jgi:hypothetical protein
MGARPAEMSIGRFELTDLRRYLPPAQDVFERLERLDDLVFDTINERRPAIDELAKSWPRLSA